MPVTPNSRQHESGKFLDLYFIAELAIIRFLRDILAADIDKSDWTKKKRRQRKSIRTEVQRILADVAQSSLAIFFPMILAAYGDGEREFEVEYAGMGREGPGRPRRSSVPTMIKKAEQKLNAMEKRVLRATDDAYRRIVRDASQYADKTVATRTKAVQDALGRFARAGISGFTDKDGKRWGMSEYAEMAVRTSMANAQIAGYIDYANANGYDLALVSDHADECEKCRPWESKVLSLTGEMRDHPDCDGLLQDAIGDGLFHPNCWHWLSVWVPGVTKKPPRPIRSIEQDAEGYKNRQRMRYCERQVRKYKRMQEAAITPEEERSRKAYVDKWLREINILNADAGTPKSRGRTGKRIKLSDAARRMKPFQLRSNGG